MSTATEPRSTGAPTIAMLAVITIVMVVLATQTDLGVVARFGIAIPSGLAAAGVVHALLGRRSQD